MTASIVLRRAYRIAAFAAVSVVLYGSYLVATTALLPFPKAAQRVHDRLLRTWARGVGRALAMRVAIEGTPPEPPFFLVANHLSYVDIVALLTCVKGTFLAKSEIAGWPLLGTLARGVGTLFIERERKRDVLRVSARIRDELARGRGIIVFPEATSTPGDEVLPFKASTFAVPLDVGLPVHVAAISYATPRGAGTPRDAVCWHGDEPFVPHLMRLTALPWFSARIRFGSEPLAAADRKRLATLARAEVAALHAGLQDAVTT
jgi:1-acyl-sn-glycerol-3-phosphate acyltransferase